ncbi:MAG TPA: Hsp20/alpha crystallin family protein [Planctomycetaceae bacterium]|nr:Hsp20/alpha crystallin family protein [Planctomycetaceae bacterium]
MPWKQKQLESGGRELSPLAALRAEIDRLFDSLIREPISHWEWPLGERGWTPPVDIGETDEEVIVRAELPGVAPEDIEVSISGGQLVLAGQKREATEKTEKGFYHTETRHGSFRRSIRLPQGVDEKQVEAEYKDGVLTVRLKKSPAVPPKRIPVQVKQGCGAGAGLGR